MAVKSSVSPERAAWAWVRRQGVSRALRREAAVRAIALVALVAWNPIVFLCSELARHITGEIVNVNGGSVLVG